MKTAFFVAIAGLVAFSTGCGPLASCLDDMSCSDGDDDDDKKNAEDAASAQNANQTAPMCVTGGKPHIGLGGIDLAAADDGPAGGDRARVKPFSALVTEYGRVLGSSPASVNSAGSTFGVAQDRWFLEPIASGVYVNKAFEVAFDGCQDLVTGDARFEVSPTKESAHDACTTWTRRFWSREATPEQLDACVSAATEGGDRPWVYACASVLTATGFLTY